MKVDDDIPFFSLILPTYNVESYIGRCLDSCVNQSYKQFEVIVVDDKGQDNSIAIARKYVEQDCRVKIISNSSNQGTFHARKKGVENALGTYILFLDPDDELSVDALKILHNRAVKKNVDIIFFGVEQVPPGRFLSESRNVQVNALTKKELVERVFLGGAKLNFGTPGQLFKRDVVTEAMQSLSVPESVRLVYAEDALLLFSTVVKSSSCESLTDKLYIYYKNPNAATTSVDFESKIKSIKQIELVLEYLARNANQYKDGYISKAALKLKNKLVYDKSHLAKGLPHEMGYGGYLRNVLLMIQCRFRFLDFLRLIIFVLTLGAKKI